MVTGQNSQPCGTQELPLNLDFSVHLLDYYLQKGRYNSIFKVQLKCAITSVSSLSVHSNKIILSIYLFFLYTYLKCYCKLRACCCPDTKDYCKTGTIPPHDTTSGKGLQSHHCQSCGVLNTANTFKELSSSSTGTGKTDQETDGTGFLMSSVPSSFWCLT